MSALIQRREEEKCFQAETFRTPYNYNDGVPAYQGIMFEVAALAEEIEVSGLELDAKLDQMTNLNMEISP